MNKMEKIKLTFVGLNPTTRAMVNRNLALTKRVVKSGAKAMKSLQNKIDSLTAKAEKAKELRDAQIKAIKDRNRELSRAFINKIKEAKKEIKSKVESYIDSIREGAKEVILYFSRISIERILELKSETVNA